MIRQLAGLTQTVNIGPPAVLVLTSSGRYNMEEEEDGGYCTLSHTAKVGMGDAAEEVGGGGCSCKFGCQCVCGYSNS